ncbi:prenyltransferase [Bacillus toyonensis]|uniref:prenyltransferase n=1 Tax=Bacillus toyonensis TaxID=155322 RepID=UPI001F0B458C|nr:prenyltransferase [Bacillus toyonensis]
MKPMRDILEMSVQVSKDPKWREKESNNLYYIPFFIYVIWNTILFGFISTGIIKINQTLSLIANLTIFLAVGILSFILLIRHSLHGIVYSKTKETPVFNYIFGSALGLIILVIPLFIDQYQWLIKEMTSLIINF